MRRNDRPGQVGDFWLSQRPNSPVWCRTWFDGNSRQTCRASLGTDDLAAARVALARWVTLHGHRAAQQPRDVLMGDVFARYMEKHGQHTTGAGVQRRNLFLALERIQEGATVAEFTLDAQQALTRRMAADGYKPGTIKRVLGATKAAVQWAWKNGELERPIPFLTVQEGPPRERIMDVVELAAMWDAAELPHLQMFFLLLLGTAGRPAAVLELARKQCDLARGLIDLNPPGRAQTKKRRPVVPMPDFLRPWIEQAPPGPLVQFRGHAVQKVNKAWREARDTAGLDDLVVPYTIRHTIATELRARGVPELELAGLLGHSMPNFRTTGRYAKYAPTHLSAARAAIDALATEIGRVGARPIHPETTISETSVRVSCVLVSSSTGGNPLITGAGEGIRTLDPNLGKVVLYP